VPFGIRDLASWATRFDIELLPRQLAQVQIHLCVLLLWNRRLSLVSQSDPSVILCKHFADSLAAAAACPAEQSIVDLGTGAGFPGMPIAVARPDVSVSLVETRRKKVSFLTEAIRIARMANTRVVEARMEHAARLREHKGQYGAVIFRALPDLAKMLGQAREYLRPGGRAVAMKGANFQRDLDRVRPSQLGCRLERVHPYELPDGARRVLLVFRFT